MSAGDGQVNGGQQDGAFRRGRTILLVAIGTVTVGLAVAGSVSRQVGGVIVLVGWILALGALHRLGRAG